MAPKAEEEGAESSSSEANGPVAAATRPKTDRGGGSSEAGECYFKKFHFCFLGKSQSRTKDKPVILCTCLLKILFKLKERWQAAGTGRRRRRRREARCGGGGSPCRPLEARRCAGPERVPTERQGGRERWVRPPLFQSKNNLCISFISTHFLCSFTPLSGATEQLQQSSRRLMGSVRVSLMVVINRIKCINHSVTATTSL